MTVLKFAAPIVMGMIIGTSLAMSGNASGGVPVTDLPGDIFVETTSRSNCLDSPCTRDMLWHSRIDIQAKYKGRYRISGVAVLADHKGIVVEIQTLSKD